MTLGKPDQNAGGLIFLHIPKTGGTTLSALIQSNYPGEKIYYLHSRSEKEKFLALPETEKNRCRILSGHFPCGIQRELPFRAWRMMTMLREPADRITSFYFHALRNPGHYLHAKLLESGMAFDAFAQSDLTLEADNFQVRMLSETMEEYARPLGDEDLQKAFRCLNENMAAFGILEKFDDSIRHFSDVFQWKNQAYTPLNGGWENNAGFQMSQTTRRAVLKRNALDAELYHSAKKLFDARVLKSWRRKWFIPDVLRIQRAHVKEF